MKPATFYVFAGLTAAAVAAAAAAVSGKLQTTSLTAGTEAAFPDLAGRVNDAARIEVRTAKGEFTLTRDGDRWGVDQKDGYPAAFEKVKSAIVGVANFKLIERKTADPERYVRLELEPPTGPEAKSRKLVFATGTGDVLADVVVGKLNADLFGAGGAGTYIRRADEKETWLVRGEIRIGAEPIDWMERQIVDYGQEHVRRVSILQPDGDRFIVAKDKEEDKNFRLLDLPEGRKMKNDDEANPLGGVMWRMMLDDVKAAENQEWPSEIWTAHYTVWNGFTVRIDVAKFGDDHWGRFSAAVDDSVTDPEARKTAKKAVDEINARVKGWSYMLTAGDSEKLTSKMEDYLDDPDDTES